MNAVYTFLIICFLIACQVKSQSDSRPRLRVKCRIRNSALPRTSRRTATRTISSRVTPSATKKQRVQTAAPPIPKTASKLNQTTAQSAGQSPKKNTPASSGRSRSSGESNPVRGSTSSERSRSTAQSRPARGSTDSARSRSNAQSNLASGSRSRTANSTQGSTASATPSFSGDKQFSDDCFKKHNVFRSSMGVRPLVWDNNLASIAYTWAKQLVSLRRLQHSKYKKGENLYATFGGDKSCSAAVQAWFDEKKFYRKGQKIGSGNFGQYGHFTQVRCARYYSL